MSPKILLRILLVAIVLSVVLSPELAFARRSRGHSGWISARAAIFSNTTAVKRYYGKNVDLRVPPASTTKVMTALLVLERLPLDKVVTVSSRIGRVQPSIIGLRAGEQLTVRNLLFALLLNSANDASLVLAEAAAGSEDQFVSLMNQRAQDLGCRNTRFANPNGLPSPGEAQYTSAYDMMLMFKKALDNDFFRKAIKLRFYRISTLGGRSILLKNHNKILMTNWKMKIYGKTGFTRAARQCFVGYFMKGNEVCIISVFGCSHRWKDIKYIVERYGGIDL